MIMKKPKYANITPRVGAEIHNPGAESTANCANDLCIARLNKVLWYIIRKFIVRWYIC